jgi:ketosteroid isomerase-like protein
MVQINRRGLFPISTMLLALSATITNAQQSADIDGVKAASQAFYTTLAVLDDGTAMGNVWANTPYVTYVGPDSKSIITGWDAQKKYWSDFNKRFSQRSVSLVDVHIHANGNLAWEIAVETGQALLKDGATRKVDWMVTNVYERIDGHWLMVSHHVQPRSQ